MYKVLTIAGSDSGGGAGIQADIKAISACGCYAASAITAVTVQNTVGVKAVHGLPVEIIEGQIDAVLGDIGADAIKVGMLHSGEVVKVVACMLEKYAIKNVVLDPVMVATSGDRLMADDAMESLVGMLIPMARIITPNIPEASALLGHVIGTQDELPDAARQLAGNFGVSVLLKAGHLTGPQLVDVLYDNETKSLKYLPAPFVQTPNTHGTGCTLSSAIAAYLAKGMSVDEAVTTAKDYIHRAIMSGVAYRIGHGHGPVDHFFMLR